ncbi:hypothetical protein NKR19_g5174 [Coniochaeta hoffmannii]|uniref:Uncharacterized protein n=1 Tax=Coniochaeta hoffmannii TaxID=91930 RepID=A0AA38VWI8_9PEZI|nr:hypothetical protein NKR19_g5174 [Coniochaeta hoffmannii]
MANLTIVLPCAVLGSICAAMLLFVWWWFPRAWNKGTKGDTEAIGMSMDAIVSGESDNDNLTPAERRREAGRRAREYLEAVDARNKARAEGREPEEPLPRYTPQGFGGGNTGARAPEYVA